jgi:acyl-CoA dehydrogenase
LTIDYVKQRKIFSQRVSVFQNPQLFLADVKTDIDVGAALLDMSMAQLREGNFTFQDGADALPACRYRRAG